MKASHSASGSSAGGRAQGGAVTKANLHLQATLLSAVGGYVDAAGFVSLLGLFPAHLTGELVADAIAVTSGHLATRARLWAFPVFFGAVVLAALVARIFRHYGLQARAGLLALVTLALGLFSASDALAWLFFGGQLPVVVRGGFAVAAMGFQSALMRESMTGACPTTVMTGNMTQALIEIVDHVVDRLSRALLRQPKLDVVARRPPVARVLLVFASSAALGGWLTRSYGSVSVALPTLLTAALMVQAWREDIAQQPSLTKTVELADSKEDRLWAAQFSLPPSLEFGTDPVACDPLLRDSSDDCTSATRVKVEPAAASALQLAPRKRRASSS